MLVNLFLCGPFYNISRTLHNSRITNVYLCEKEKKIRWSVKMYNTITDYIIFILEKAIKLA